MHLFLQNRINLIKTEYLRKTSIGINDQTIIKEVGTNKDLLKSNVKLQSFLKTYFL